MFLYHVTSKFDLDDIEREGLLPHKPSYREEQDYWPNGGREGRVYFATTPEIAMSFSEPGHVMLRVEKSILNLIGLFKEFETDFYTRKKIPPQYIQVLSGGEWRSLKDKS